MGRSYYQVVKNKVLKDCMRKGLSENRVRKYLQVLEEAKKLRVNFRKLNKKEIDKYYFWLVNSKYKQWTKVTKWKIFKRICKLIKKNINFDDWVLRRPRIEPEILSLREIRAIVENIKDFRDKLIVLLLYESGIRIGELLRLRVKDVMFDEYGALLRVGGKTGVRYVRVVKCANLLKAWIQMNAKDKLFEVSQRWIAQVLKEASKKAGIKKRVYPHLLRHTRATHLARFLTEPELRVYFGWSKDSKMPSVYVHLSSRDVDRKIIELSLKDEIVLVRQTIFVSKGKLLLPQSQIDQSLKGRIPLNKAYP